MKLLLISRNPNLPTISRIYEESKHLNLELQLFNPEYFSLSFADTSGYFEEVFQSDRILNRYTSVNEQDLDLELFPKKIIDKHINHPLGVRTTRSKLNQLVYFTENNYQTIPSLISKGLLNEEVINTFIESHGDCYLAKPIRGNGGKGITLFDSARSLKSYLESCHDLRDQNFIIQPIIPSAIEIRVFLVNFQALYLIKKETNQNQEDLRLNLSRNPSIEFLNPQNDNSTIVEQAVKISKDLGLKLCAIDFLINKDNEYILEINSVPGWEQLEKEVKRSNPQKNLTREILEHIIE